MMDDVSALSHISISVNNDGDLVVVGLDLGLVDIGIRILASVIGFS